jgi:hypothetical protein
MQKKRVLLSRGGLFLISVVTLVSAVMVVFTAFSLNRHSAELVADELRWHNDAQASLAAESGLMIGTVILGHGESSGAPTTIDLDGGEVTVEVTDDGACEGYVRVVSTVRHSGLDYDKRVEWQVRAEKRSLPGGKVKYFPVVSDSAGASASSAGVVKRWWKETTVPRS